MNWTDTVRARSHGLVEGYHSHNATREEIDRVEGEAREADRPERAHARQDDATVPVALGGPTEAETLERLVDQMSDDAGSSTPEYSNWRVDELRAELDRRGLPTEGVKADLVSRLEAEFPSERA